MLTAGRLLHTLTTRLAAAGIDDPRLDARLLVAEALGVSPGSLITHPDRPVSAGEAERLETFAARRAAREPVSRILGRRGFWTLELEIGPAVLDPRPDTETLVEAVLARIPDRSAPLRVLDFGTGSGCILLALLSELPNATGLGIDRSEEALSIARRNGIPRARFALGDWGDGLAGSFDIIVSNPPYIPDGDIPGLEPEVCRYDPRLALAGGPDGLDCYRRLAPDIARLLAPGGLSALEVGQGQASDVGLLLTAAGLTGVSITPDLAGIARVVIADARQ